MKLKKLNASAEDRIKEAAKKVFVQKGYAGARMQDIANEAKINKALLHYYFRSKDQLFELSKKVGEQEAQRTQTHFIPTEEDLQNIESVLQSFEKNNKVVPSEVVNSQETIIPAVDESVTEVVEEPTTTETTYFVDDEEVKVEETTNEEEQPKIKRLSYSK